MNIQFAKILPDKVSIARESRDKLFTALLLLSPCTHAIFFYLLNISVLSFDCFVLEIFFIKKLIFWEFVLIFNRWGKTFCLFSVVTFLRKDRRLWTIRGIMIEQHSFRWRFAKILNPEPVLSSWPYESKPRGNPGARGSNACQKQQRTPRRSLLCLVHFLCKPSTEKDGNIMIYSCRLITRIMTTIIVDYSLRLGLEFDRIQWF